MYSQWSGPVQTGPLLALLFCIYLIRWKIDIQGKFFFLKILWIISSAFHVYETTKIYISVVDCTDLVDLFFGISVWRCIECTYKWIVIKQWYKKWICNVFTNKLKYKYTTTKEEYKISTVWNCLMAFSIKLLFSSPKYLF